MENHLHDLLANGGLALGAQLRFGSAPIAELFAAAGFDFVVIDGEHAPQTPVGIRASSRPSTATRARRSCASAVTIPTRSGWHWTWVPAGF